MSTVESCNITSPFGTETKCAKLVITDVTQEFALEDIMQKGETYTFSAWVKSDGAGSITIGKDTFLTSKEWGRIRTTFDATSEDFSLGFDALGAYYLLQSQLETGNKGTDWTPNPDDIDRRFSNIELQITKEGIKTIIGDTYQTKDGMKDYVTLVSYESYIEQTAKDIESCVKTTDYTGKEIASRINQSATTVMIEAEHLALEGQILISHFGEDVTEKFSDIDSAIKNAKETADGAAKTIADLCIEEDITYIDGSKIYTGSVTAEQIDVESIFAQDVIATGTIRGPEIIGGTISGASGDFKGKIEASSGSIGPFNIEQYEGINASYFHDSDAVQYDVNFYGKALHYTITGHDDSVYRVLYYTHKAGDPDEGWKYETDTLIGAIDTLGDGFKTLIYNSLGGHILIGEGVELCGTFVSLPSEVTFAAPVSARLALGIDTGYISSTSIEAGSYVDVAITFNKIYTTAPCIYLTFISTSTASGIGAMEAVITARTTTGATARIFNNSNATRAPGVQWVAIGE